jgi:hypothetical protein
MEQDVNNNNTKQILTKKIELVENTSRKHSIKPYDQSKILFHSKRCCGIPLIYVSYVVTIYIGVIAIKN